MKKKLIIMTAVATLLTVATVAMANGGLIFAPIEGVEEVFEPSFDRLAAHMGYDTEEKFSAFHRTALFMGRHCNDKESFSFIENMILDGCDAQLTMDIYQFYLTTNEDISIVREIYDMVYTGEPIENNDIAFETAFNSITNNKCGVLTKEDVASYMNQGLTVTDISQANVLSRKGVMTIQEILDALLSGTSLADIEKTIYGEDAPLSISEENKRLEDAGKKVNKKLKAKGYWKGKKTDNFDRIAEKAGKKGISKEKLSKLLDEGYSELDLINAINQPECTTNTIDTFVKKAVTE